MRGGGDRLIQETWVRAASSVGTIRILKALRKHLLTVAGATVLLAVAIVSHAAITSSQPRTLTETALILVSFTTFAALLLIFVMYYELAVAKRKLAARPSNQRDLELVLRHLQHILESRTGINTFYTQMYLEGNSQVNLGQATEAYVNDLIYRSKLMFDHLTGDNCSVCVKLFSTPITGSYPETPQLTNTIRDPSSAAERLTDRNQVVAITENTAFLHICSRTVISGFYFNNDLYRSYLSGTYVNSRPNWFRYYNATAVSAIMNPAQGAESEVLGFLCIDNFRGRFDSEATYSLMRSLCACLFYVYKNLDLIGLKAPPSPVQQKGAK